MENTAVGVIDFDSLFTTILQEEYKEKAIEKIKGYISTFEGGIVRKEMVEAKTMLENTIVMMDAILSCSDDDLKNPEAICEAIIQRLSTT